MKKGLFIVSLAVIAVIVYFLFFSKKDSVKPSVTRQKPVALTISKNPRVFNTAFGSMLSAYYTLKDDLVNWDSLKAGNDAGTLMQLARKVPYDSLQADKNIVLTAKNFSGVIATESETLNNAKTIEGKRRSFNTISDNLYSLINTVRYDEAVIYHDVCPMAFNGDEQAYWLSSDSAISNPYLGNKHPKYKSGMATCGNVEDEVNFTAKK